MTREEAIKIAEILEEDDNGYPDHVLYLLQGMAEVFPEHKELWEERFDNYE